MVLEEISQLIEDCNVKREVLVQHREKIHSLQKELLKFAAISLPKDDLTDLEHYQNQFHIQLINIHDLRHDLKMHQQRLKTELHIHEDVSDNVIQKHKEMDGHFETLAKLLEDLEEDFNAFLKRPH